MEAIYTQGPIATYLEGDGMLEPELDLLDHTTPAEQVATASFAPSNKLDVAKRRKHFLTPLRTIAKPPRAIRDLHDAWSTAVNSRIGRSDNARFLEHFRYVIVASQLLNEFLDQGALQPQEPLEIVNRLDTERAGLAHAAISPIGVAAVAFSAFVCASLLHWVRVSGLISRRRAVLVFVVYAIAAALGYAYCRKQWLRYVRRRAIETASGLTTSWQSFEMSSMSAISLVQEVELVSKGYRLSTPLPPISRVEENGANRRCARLRKTLHSAYAAVIPSCTTAVAVLGEHVNEDDLEKYYEIYDINPQDVKDALGTDALTVIDDDKESLKSLRVLSFRAGILRRVVLCNLMSLPADGGKPDMKRWRKAVDAMVKLSEDITHSTERVNAVLHDMETLTVPVTPIHKASHTPTREKMRSQVRKISTLSTGIRSLQAKMQILREETNRSIEKSDDLTDLGADLMTQYESIGADIKELMEAWELGKTSLQSNITKQERRISMASSGIRSPVSSIGGLTAVEEDGTPADALRALNGDLLSDRSNRSSTGASSPSEEEIFEAVAAPRLRSAMTREERIAKMLEDRERQATVRAARDANTSMLKELESVINLRPRKSVAQPDQQGQQMRVMSL